jgi:hypothetical protein
MPAVFHRLAMWWIILAHEAEDDGPYSRYHLALQLPFCFEVRSLSERLVSSTPE